MGIEESKKEVWRKYLALQRDAQIPSASQIIFHPDFANKATLIMLRDRMPNPPIAFDKQRECQAFIRGKTPPEVFKLLVHRHTPKVF